MKKILIHIFLVLCYCSTFAQTTLEKQQFSVKFNIDDFSMEMANDSTMTILPKATAGQYGITTEGFCMPIGYNSFAFNGCKDYIRLSYHVYSHKIINDVILSQAPQIISTDGAICSSPQNSVIATGVFPASKAKYTGLNRWDELTIMHFETYPFVYDANKKELSFVDSISLTITFREGQNSVTLPFIPSIVKNFPISNSDFSLDRYLNFAPSPDPEKQIDYALITTNELKSAFYPLINWKRTKGVRADIFTVEDIESEYSYGDTQLKIKRKLYDLYLNNGLKYVLLGGDDTVVPVRGCFGQVNDTTYRDYTIPTDLYYSCFSGAFDWDSDGNGVYGELTDNVDLYPSVYTTRLPVRTISHIQSYTDKLLDYEKTPRYNNKILMTGCKLWGVLF